MKVFVTSKAIFDRDVVSKLKEDSYDNHFFISILDPEVKEPFLQDEENYKTFWFFDLEEKFNNFSDIFNSDMAKEMIDFIEQNRDKKTCIVHCTAGVSRSGAVGEFINDNWGDDSRQEFKRRHPHICPNSLVRKLLNQEYEKYNN